MKEKYLPIGTICTLKGKNKKTLIVGYFSIEYKGNAIMYDYSGYDYPEGLLRNKKYSFNHGDIKQIDYLGYVCEEFEILNKHLLGQHNSKEKADLNTNSFFKNITFDENGVVIFEELQNEVSSQEKTIFDSKTTIDNNLNNFFIETRANPSNVIENAEDSQNWSIFNNIKFDENGTIIEDDLYVDDQSEKCE